MSYEDIPEELREFDEGNKAALNVLLKQYSFLRDEITQVIYIKHAAILALYAFLGVIIANLVKKIVDGSNHSLSVDDLDTTILFLLTLIMVQVIINGFGSLFLKEQARDRRTCSFLRAIEYLINEKIGEIGIYWENYITYEFVEEKFRVKDLFKFPISVNLEYHKYSFLGVGLPVFLPNLLITCAMGVMGIHVKTAVYMVFFIVSLVITIMWSLMIMRKTWKRSKEETGADMEDVLEWLRKEKSKLLLKGVSSTFTLERDEVEIEIHVDTYGLSKKIYDMEIFPEDQKLPWKSIEGITAPRGWNSENKSNRVRFYTEWNPLKKCEPIKCKFKIKPKNTKNTEICFIKVHLTGENGKNIGEITSWPGIASTFTIEKKLPYRLLREILGMTCIEENLVKLKIHVLKDELDRKFYDVKILSKNQEPPWENFGDVKDVELPEGWEIGDGKNGVKFCTKERPLKKCEPVMFGFKVQATKISRYIKVDLMKQDGSMETITSIKI